MCMSTPLKQTLSLSCFQEFDSGTLFHSCVCVPLQGMLLIIPGMLLTGWSSSAKVLYLGLVLYSFGTNTMLPLLYCGANI